jgi:stage IV sporulation protein FB
MENRELETAQLENEEYIYYPPKPEVIETNTSSIPKLLFSLLAFIAVFYLLGVDLNLIFLIVLVLFIHEMGHLIAMKTFGYEDVGMLFIPLIGAVVSGRKENLTQLQKIIVVLAGPIPGIFIGALLIELGNLGMIDERFTFMGIIFIILNALNLIPVDPLDGGRFFESIFFSLNSTLKILFSIFSAALVLFLSFFYYFEKGLSMEFFVFSIIGFFMISRIQSTFKLKRLHSKLKSLQIDISKSFHQLTDKEYWLIRREFIKSSKLNKLVEAESKEYDDTEEAIAPAIKNIMLTNVEFNVPFIGKLGFVVLWLASLAISFYYLYPFVEGYLNQHN